MFRVLGFIAGFRFTAFKEVELPSTRKARIGLQLYWNASASGTLRVHVSCIRP